MKYSNGFVMVNWYFRYVIVATFLLFSSAAYFLRQSKTDYYVALLVTVISFVVFMFLKNKRLQRIDVLWVLCSVYALLYMLAAMFDGGSAKVVLIQGLMFLLPLSSLAVRNIDFSMGFKELEKWIFIFVGLKLLLFTLHFDQVFSAMTSTHSRQRFHDYASICLVFIITATLLYGYTSSLTKKIILSFCLLFFLVTAAHRSLYIAVFVQFLYWFLGYKGGNLSNKVTYSSLLLLLSIVLFSSSYGETLIGLFSDSLEGTDGNTNMRVSLYSTVLIGATNDFFGIGFGKFYLYGVTYFGDRVHYALHHNSYLSVVYYLGVIPSILFLSFFVRLFIFEKAVDRNTSFCKNILLGMAIFAIFNVFFEQPIYGLVFWLIYGMFMSLKRAAKLSAR